MIVEEENVLTEAVERTLRVIAEEAEEAAERGRPVRISVRRYSYLLDNGEKGPDTILSASTRGIEYRIFIGGPCDIVPRLPD